jgi:hypothetical protein
MRKWWFIGLSLLFSPGMSTINSSGRQPHAAAKLKTSYQSVGRPYLLTVHDLDLTGNELVFQCALRKVVAPSDQCPGFEWHKQKLHVGFYDGVHIWPPLAYTFKNFRLPDEFLVSDAELVSHWYRVQVPQEAKFVIIGFSTVVPPISVDLQQLARECNPKSPKQ